MGVYDRGYGSPMNDRQQRDAKDKKVGQVPGQPMKHARKTTEYGRQLNEKQKVRNMYGMRERQFRKFFHIAIKSRVGMPGENLLSLLERRLDNVVYRLKMSTTRAQARQVVVHGHVLVNGQKVYAPSYLVEVNDVVTLAENVSKKTVFLESVIDKRLKMGIKTPEWLEVDKQSIGLFPRFALF